MFTTRKGLLLILIVFLMTGGFASLKHFVGGSSAITVSEQARTHILYGDKSGGGHKFGGGKSCKSEFPKGWNDDEIIDTIQTMAANDNLKWRQQKNGYYTAEDTVDGTRVRVVLNKKRDGVVTAYPLNTKRNPCPARQPLPANDNFNH